MARLIAAGILVVSMAACDAAQSSGTGAAVQFVGPSVVAPPLLTAKFIDPTFAPTVCPVPTSVVGTFGLAVTASAAVVMSELTIQMIDGSNLGGPMVTFPQQKLIAQFGTTRIAPGVTAGSHFSVTFSCSGLAPRGLLANLVFLDAAGLPHSVTVIVNLP
jgi:hypothetical protein